jgi:hypothetical protein
MPNKVFISYRHTEPDQRLAKALYTCFTNQGLEVFIDAEIGVGSRWSEEIERNLLASEYFIVLLSKNSIRSEMVRYEIKLAHEQSSMGRLRIFPVRISYQGALPYDLGVYLDPIQYAFWQDNESSERICSQLAQAILRSASLPVQPKNADCGQDHLDLRELSKVTEQGGAPLPVADPRLETGALHPSSPFYIKRREDHELERLVWNNQTVVVKAPRQFGKSSFMARAISLAKRQNVPSCFIDFQLLDNRQFDALETVCRYVGHKLSRSFQTSIKPEDVWDDWLGPKESLTIFVEEAILSSQKQPVLICLDEVDRILDREFRDDFFTLVRGWHNRRATEDGWKHLNLVIVHSTETSLWIRDPRISPFNVGQRFTLPPFNLGDIYELNRRHGKALEKKEDIEALLRFVGGQPYLVRVALFTCAQNGWSISELRRRAIEDPGPFSDHLRDRIISLRRSPKRLSAFKEVLHNSSCQDELDFEVLLAAGLVKGKRRSSISVHCELYEQYFRENL